MHMRCVAAQLERASRQVEDRRRGKRTAGKGFAGEYEKAVNTAEFESVLDADACAPLPPYCLHPCLSVGCTQGRNYACMHASMPACHASFEHGDCWRLQGRGGLCRLLQRRDAVVCRLCAHTFHFVLSVPCMLALPC